MLKIVPINQAEAICMPLFDEKLSNLSDFTFSAEGVGCGFSQAWDSCLLHSEAKDFFVKWRGLFTLEDYDAIRISINFHEHLLLTGRAVVNGKEVLLFENISGAKVPIEPTSKPLIAKGEIAEITELTFSFHCTGGCIGKHSINFYWVGLLNTDNEILIEEQLPQYTVDSWEGLINFNGKNGVNRYNLFFSEDELIEMKERMSEPFFANMMKKLKNEVEQFESFVPEKEIREYIPQIEHMYRYVRVRDRDRTCIDGLAEAFAVAGYLFDRQDWSIMAARLIMSIVHTPKWFEGPMGCMEGSTWHHGCFNEDHISSRISIALGFMGDIFTEKGIELIMDAIERAWAVVNTCAEMPSYRWFMNQGIVLSGGRIMGASVLYRNGRDYGKYIEQSYEDHTVMVNNYLNDEGHCTEGGYYQYSFTCSIPLWMVYANYKKVDIIGILPEKFIKSVKYVNAVLSSNNDFGYAQTLGAGGYNEYDTMILAFFASVLKWDKAYKFLEKRARVVNPNRSVGEAINFLAMLKFMPEDFPKFEQRDSEINLFKDGGLLTYGFCKPYFGKLWFQCERNPLTGHSHEDRGGVILEVNGKTMLVDLGTTNYSNTMFHFMHLKEYHNVAYPDGLNMKLKNTIVIDPNNPKSGKTEFTTAEEYYPGPTFDRFKEKASGVEFGADLKPIYGDEVIIGRRDGFLELNGDSIQLALTDKWLFDSKRALNIRFLSYSPWEIRNNMAISTVEDMEMTIKFSEAGGLKIYFNQNDSILDSNLKKVHTLKVFIEAAEAIEVFSDIIIKNVMNIEQSV